MPRAKTEPPWVAVERWETEDPPLLRIEVAIPPSVNHLYQRRWQARGSLTLSAQSRACLSDVVSQVQHTWDGRVLPAYLDVEVWLYVPTLRTLDADNAPKLLIDGLAKALGFNDMRVVDLVVHKRLDPVWPRCVLLVRGAGREASRE